MRFWGSRASEAARVRLNWQVGFIIARCVQLHYFQPVTTRTAAQSGGFDGARERLPCWPHRGYLSFRFEMCPPGATVGTLEIFSRAWYWYIRYRGNLLPLFSLLTLSVRTCCASATSSFLPGPSSWPSTYTSLLEFQQPGASTLRSDTDNRDSTSAIRIIIRRGCHIDEPAELPDIVLALFAATADTPASQKQLRATCCIATLSLG